jgi:hypothetical protein
VENQGPLKPKTANPSRVSGFVLKRLDNDDLQVMNYASKYPIVYPKINVIPPIET